MELLRGCGLQLGFSVWFDKLYKITGIQLLLEAVQFSVEEYALEIYNSLN